MVDRRFDYKNVHLTWLNVQVTLMENFDKLQHPQRCWENTRKVGCFTLVGSSRLGKICLYRHNMV